MATGLTRRRAVSTLTAGLLAVLAGLLGVGTAHTQQQGQLYYYYQGQKKLLTPSADQLSVGLKMGESLPSLAAIAPTMTGVEADAAALTGSVQRVTLRPAGAPPVRSGPTRMPRNLALPAPGSPEAARPAAPSPEALKARMAQQRQTVATARPQALQAYRSDPAVKYAYEALVSNQTGGLLYPTDRIIVKVKAGVSEADLRGKLPASLRELNPMLAAGQYLLELTDPKQDHPVVLAAQLQETAAAWLDWAEPDFIQTWQQSVTPTDDPLYGSAAPRPQWHLNNSGESGGAAGADSRVANAWGTVTSGGDAVIAVIDDGVQNLGGGTAHPDLNVTNARAASCTPTGGTYGYDFAEGDTDPSPNLSNPSHGTAVAGVAAAKDNTAGGLGACPGCSIVAVRIFDDSGSATTNSNIVSAITYGACVADILNNSWGGGNESTAITTAVQNAIAGTGTVKRGSLGAPVLFATGNSASGYVQFGLNLATTGSYTFEWRYEKDGSVGSGYDTAWLDYVIYSQTPPNGESFEGAGSGCVLPGDWTPTGNAPWTVIDAEVRAASQDGGHCSLKAGTISHGQTSGVKVTKSLTAGQTLYFSAWVSSEPDGPIKESGCYDKLSFYVNDSSTPVVSLCGTYSNQGTRLADGAITYPASIPGVIAVGAATNFDRRSDFSQWGPGTTILAHSSGGTLNITTTDITGGNGYSDGSAVTTTHGDTSTDPDYANSFGGTSSATPLAAGIVGLYISSGQPGASKTAAQIKTDLQTTARQIGCDTYTSGFANGYGYGVADAQVLVGGSSAGNPNPCTVGLGGYDPNISSGFLTESKPAGPPTNSVGGGGDNAACMIAFLTQGWLPDRFLNPLRRARGWLMAQGPWGRSLVRSYYRTSALLIRWLEAPALSAAVLGAP